MGKSGLCEKPDLLEMRVDCIMELHNMTKTKSR